MLIHAALEERGERGSKILAGMRERGWRERGERMSTYR
jgi:hypothetical protein